MANFNKSYNFRNGFQVDDTVLIVRGNSVGIGSSVPASRLDVDGTITAKGLNITSEAEVGINSANVGFLSVTTINSGVASISAGIITATSPSGIVTYYGDGRFLSGLPTSQWIDIDVGLGYTSIYAAGNVGVDTTDPRYPFQVGGVPFPTITGPSLPAQNGVGIDRGNVYASGIVSTRGEFVGLGSNITAINGSNITVGAIGSMAYGPLIVTDEVIADKFTGIASTAISVTPDATLRFDTARANEFTAVNRFISTEGNLQIGDDEINSNVGDIQVRKNVGFSRIYSISDTSSSRIFVGTQKPGGSANGFGGLRFGGNSGDLSGINDLDLINYDVGNVNFYVNSGVAATDKSLFQFINGRNDQVLAELDQQGKFKLNSDGNVGSISLDVIGIATFSDAVYIDEKLTTQDIDTENITVFNDININGSININNPVFAGIVTVTESLVVGNDPESTNISGVKLKDTGDIFANFGGIFLGSSGSEYFKVTNTGVGSFGSNLDVQGVLSSISFETGSITVDTLLSGPNNFTLTSSGLILTDANITNLQSTSANLTSATIGSLDITGFIDINGGTNITNNNITVDTLTVNNSIAGNFTSLPGGITFNGDIIAGQANLSGLSVAGLSTFASNVQVINVDSVPGNDIIVNSDVDLQSNSIENIDAIESNSLSTFAALISNYVNLNDVGIQVELDGTNGIIITVRDDGNPGPILGTITLEFD